EDIALHRTLLAPWMPDLPETLDRAKLNERCGRDLTDDDLETLIALRVVEPTPEDDVFQVAPALLGLGMALLDLGLPRDVAVAAQRIFHEHGTAIARELNALFRTEVWPRYKEARLSPEQLQQIVERFKPVTVQALVTAYETAVNEMQRESVRRRR